VFLVSNAEPPFNLVKGGIATQMFTAVSREIAPGPPEIPRLLEVLKQNGVTVASVAAGRGFA